MSANPSGQPEHSWKDTVRAEPPNRRKALRSAMLHFAIEWRKRHLRREKPDPGLERTLESLEKAFDDGWLYVGMTAVPDKDKLVIRLHCTNPKTGKMSPARISAYVAYPFEFTDEDLGE
jgi:hypothetical protein